MDLTIEQTCPSCGAPIILHEADRLITCPYCDVGNYLAAGGIARFVLPDKAPEDTAREDLMYVPYLRFKGNMFCCQGVKIEHKVVDTTHQGMVDSAVPVSLGLRPQAMNLVPVTGALVGRFFRQTEKPAAVLAKADASAMFSGDAAEPLYHRAFIGETVSCIYLPVYLRDGFLVDAVLNRPLGQAAALAEQMAKMMPYKAAWSPRFLSALCPQCAGVLIGERDSLVLSCANCETLWSERQGRFEKVRRQVFKSVGEGNNELNLPFWRIRPGTEGVALASFGDFLRLTNQPVAVTGEHDNQDFSFWIPAFKIRPNIFLHLAKSLTLSQHRIPVETTDKIEKLYPVTLPAVEAFQSLKTVLADMTLDKRHFLPQLPAIALQARQVDLVYLPFDYLGHDLVQQHTTVSVSSTALQFGRSL